MIRWIVIGVVFAVGASALSDDSEVADERLQFMTAAAKSFEFLADETTDPFVLRAEPLMRWSNPISNLADGGLFLWTEGGRPAAVVKFYQKTDGTWLHNLQSLATRSFSAKRDGRLVWRPREPGVTFRPIPDAPTPAKSSAQRKLQLRRLARGFHLEELYQDEDVWQLRRLTTPLTSYQSASTGVLDGALFAYVVGTNPEAVLTIEAHESSTTGADERVWMYALAPLTGYAVTAKHDGVEVWSAERRRLNRPMTEPYTSGYFQSGRN